MLTDGRWLLFSLNHGLYLPSDLERVHAQLVQLISFRTGLREHMHFTLYNGRGVWKQQPEDNFALHLRGTEGVLQLVEDLCAEHEQACYWDIQNGDVIERKRSKRHNSWPNRYSTGLRVGQLVPVTPRMAHKQDYTQVLDQFFILRGIND